MTIYVLVYAGGLYVFAQWWHNFIESQRFETKKISRASVSETE